MRHGSAGGDASELPRGVSQRAAPEVPVRVRGSLPHAGLLLQPSPPTGTAITLPPTRPCPTYLTMTQCIGLQKLPCEII